jgi:hypothetical protein
MPSSAAPRPDPSGEAAKPIGRRRRRPGSAATAAAGEPAGGADLADLHAGLAERRQHDGELKAHALDRRAQEMLAPVLPRQAR